MIAFIVTFIVMYKYYIFTIRINCFLTDCYNIDEWTPPPPSSSQTFLLMNHVFIR